MNAELHYKIESLDVAEPYVWRLRLSEDDFLELEEAVKTVNREELLTPKWAKMVIVYIAEWYKRRYGASSNDKDALNLSSSELENIWKASGININRFVYCDVKGNHRWKYSMYVLGGLAIHLEIGHDRTLKALCRMYYSNGEDFDNEKIKDDFGDETKAASFRESIKKHHSLYHYLQEILKGRPPFCKEELSDPHSDVNRFVVAIKKANDEVRPPKFRFEWRITNSPDSKFYIRKLLVLLAPEETGEGRHEYLNFDRLASWGIPTPEKVHKLKVGIRFFYHANIIQEIDWKKPLYRFWNTGSKTTWFLSMSGNHQNCKILPEKFTKLQIVVQNEDDGSEYLVQTETDEKLCEGYMQLWRVSPYNNHWSSKQDKQRETAILFSSPWQLTSQSEGDDIKYEVVTKRFKDMSSGEALLWNWYNIHDTATLSYGEQSISFCNQQGEFTISNRAYNNTIRYVGDGCVKFFEDEEDFEELPLIFKKEDIIVHHFKKKDDDTKRKEESYVIEEMVPDKIEFKNGDGYTSWTQDIVPLYGKLTLRITIKERQEKPIQMCYLPPFSSDQPIVRDFAHTSILYKTYNENNAIVNIECQDKIVKDYVPLQPTKTITIRTTNGYAEIDVWRPTLHKEVIFDQRLIQYLDDGEQLDLPYIFKNRVAINDFSREGFRHYDCSSLRTIYTDSWLDVRHNPNMATAALIAWCDNKRGKAAEFDMYAPECLNVCFGKSPDEKTPPSNCNFYSWNYSKKQELQLCNRYERPQKKGIVFQDLSQNENLSCYYPLINDDLSCDDEEDYIEYSHIACFNVATRCGIYYFEMEPLRKLEKKDYAKEIYESLCIESGGHLTDKDREGLHRFAEEFGFSWQDEFHINIDKK